MTSPRRSDGGLRTIANPLVLSVGDAMYEEMDRKIQIATLDLYELTESNVAREENKLGCMVPFNVHLSRNQFSVDWVIIMSISKQWASQHFLNVSFLLVLAPQSHEFRVYCSEELIAGSLS